MPAHRNEIHADAAGERGGRLQPRRRRGMQGTDHRDRKRRCHCQRQIVQAVVVHDVEAIGTVFREFQHEPEVGVMVREELRMRHRRITAGEATRPERPDPQVSARDVGVGTVRGEQGTWWPTRSNARARCHTCDSRPPANG